MKLIMYLVLGGFIFSTLGCKSKEIKNPSSIDELLPGKAYSIIKNADRVQFFALNPIKKPDSNKKKIGDYVILKEGKFLDEEHRRQFISILMDDNTYDFKYAKRGFSFPDYGAIIERDGKAVHLLIDFRRKELVFLYDGKEYKEDFDSAEKQIKAIADYALPK